MQRQRHLAGNCLTRCSFRTSNRNWSRVTGSAAVVVALIVALVVVVGLAGCTGESGWSGSPTGSDPSVVTPSKPAGDKYAPCIDPAKCCGPSDTVCWGDPDKGSVCQCRGLWDCSKNPKKCDQATPLPPGGGSGWSCSWTTAGYTCTGKPSTAPQGTNGWSCSKDGAGTWTCKHTPPNPTNTPEGVGGWTCVVDSTQGKLVCDRNEPTPPPTPPTPTPTPPSPPPLPKKETNCADGIDNDGDGLVDCKDPDCPACPPPACPPGQECCDGIDNDGDGKIDEDNVCGKLGNGEPCPPGAYQACDCYCGVHRKCQPNGTWGPCLVDSSCKVAQIISQAQCGFGTVCDFGKCVPGGWDIGGECKTHNDCLGGKVCDLGWCVKDNYVPWKCP